MQNDPRSHGLWERTAPPSPATAPLAGDLKADVVVVGGGYTGLSTALHAARDGLDVVLLEGVEIGFGGSGRNVGLVNAGMWVMPDDVPATLGREHGDRLLDLLGDAPKRVFELVRMHGIDCELETAGTLHCAVGAKGLAELGQRAEQWLARGADVRLLDAAETAAKIGSPAYAGSLLDRRAGTIQPLAYVRGLARAALEHGARIHTQSPVRAAEKVPGGWRVATETGSVTADWIVVATDAYTNLPWSEIRTEQIHLPYFNFATVPLDEALRRSILPERQGAWDTKDVLSSFRFDRAGRLVFGSVGALRGTGARVHRAWAKRALARIFPQLGDVAFEAEWYGQIGMTENSLPRFHRLAPNVVAFSGYNGRGIAPGTVFGRLLAEHVAGRIGEADLPLPVTDAREARLRRLKEAYYEVGAQIAHLADARL
ncbi:NAD(P)/FAD-dependent oxidoreductase [Kaistia granuli]|uniref:NAD(P)/FAD-dependent oxidoreductase n=1 Tax=Kaistia granuli TaxID=363259 RepID=UPI00039E76B6|nr:FAD-binding oxidoreductase [Kaistia granuli]